MKIRTKVAALVMAGSTAGLLGVAATAGSGAASACGSSDPATTGTAVAPGAPVYQTSSGIGVSGSAGPESGYVVANGTQGPPPSGDITASGTGPQSGTAAVGNDSAAGGSVCQG